MHFPPNVTISGVIHVSLNNELYQDCGLKESDCCFKWGVYFDNNTNMQNVGRVFQATLRFPSTLIRFINLLDGEPSPVALL